MKIAITTNATDNYMYALRAVLQAVSQNIYELSHRNIDFEIRLILVGNESIRKAEGWAKELGFSDEMAGPHYSTIHVIECAEWVETEKYKEEQNLMVSQMRMAAANEARRWGADYLWYLDADVIPTPNSLTCSLSMLAFDNGYYDVAFCPYPSQGGGSFLGGHGDPMNPIFTDFKAEEREMPEDVEKELKDVIAAFESNKNRENYVKMMELRRKIEKEYPPKFNANVMKHNAEFGWRRRGWLDFAYPAIGKGAIVPTDWWGFGCTLMSRKAVSYMDFLGYYGKGTEDLYTGHYRIGARDLRSCCITHCPASHVLRHGEDREIVLSHAFHELREGDGKGHLRREQVPFFDHWPGEEYHEKPEKQRIHSDPPE